MNNPVPHQASGEALDFAPKWWRVALASVGDAVITTDVSGKITFLNSVAESLTGWTMKEAVDQSLDDVYHILSESSRQEVESPTARVLRQGVIVGLANHTLLIARDGTERPIDDSAAPIHNDAGENIGAVLVFRDISERKKLEKTMQDALVYADNIIATLRQPFLVLNSKLQIVTANHAFYQNFQVTQEESQGRFIYELGNRQWDIPKLRTLLEEVLPNNVTFDVEHDFPSIGRKFMQLNARRIRKPGNNSELILLSIEDITDRKRAEIAMKDSEVQYRRLFETAQDAILIIDARTGKITDANPFIEQLLGYSHAEFVGRQLWEFGVFSDKSANEAAFRELQDVGYIRFEHLPLETKGGKAVEVEFVSNVYEVDHHLVIQCNIRDISQRSILERQTHDQAAELSELHRRKDEFLAMLSHELRNPLAPILNAALLLRLSSNRDRLHGIENPILQQSAIIIERQVGQLVRIVDELLEVSRITTGKIQLLRERIALGSVVQNALETARPLLDERRHQLTLPLPSQPVWLNADAARLEQVVVNLLSNACKYTTVDGHIWVTLHQDGPEAILSIRDNGVGIAPDVLPRVFDLFAQADQSLDRSQGGLGIGLALVQRLVEMHGGKVAAFSTLGEGSEFVVRLPTADCRLPIEAKADDANRNPAIENQKSLRVLVVDDNVDTVTTLAMLVRESGHDVRTAFDGSAVLETALDFRPQVVLLDIGLPGLNGFEVARRIRQQKVLKDVVLVAMTGYGQSGDRARSKEAGFDHHLVKPGDFAKVLEILATVKESLRQ
ncbi:MAG TPA: PAS domain S-box protein [Planctomycetaceae bacterium]|nr:PAS domain S-box protein [Planctomycetaceae bacterium]